MTTSDPTALLPVPEQRAAIDDRERDLFLAAGAGTGKTAVLVERFCAAVLEDRGEDGAGAVDSVLAFTFTERAAGELKRRIRAELARRAGEAEDPIEARRLRSLARESESAWISTIHSFCRRILASHPLAAGLDPEFAVLDQSEAARLAARAFDAAFRRFADEADEDGLDMVAAFRLDELRGIVRAAHDELRSRGFERPELPQVDPPDIGAALAELRAAAAPALDFCRALKASRHVSPRVEAIAAAVAATEGGRRPSDEDVAGWVFKTTATVTGPEVDRYLAACGVLERRLVEERFAHHYGYLRELVGLFGEQYGRVKDDRSALDFEDLQLRARALLSDRPEVRALYRGRFRHLMVDEFQDTNALQLAIVSLLHLEDGEPANRLFTVGDELQSIYGFRHADVEVFRRRRAEVRELPEEVAGDRRLAGSFRSRPEILALVNRVGSSLFPEAYEPLAAGVTNDATGDEPRVEVLVTEREGWDDDPKAGEVSADERAQRWRVEEARLLARRLRELRDAGVPRGDMAVLLRSYSHVEAYEQELEDAGLAPYVAGGRGYWSNQQVTDVRNLLAAVANPLDDRALFGVIASPACGASSDALWLLRHAAGHRRPVWPVLAWLYGPGRTAEEDGEAGEGDGLVAWRERVEEAAAQLPEEDADALRGLVGTLGELRREAPLLSLERLIDRAITATGYDLALLMRDRGHRRMANVRKLMRLARDFEADAGRDLRAFLDHAADEAEASAREAEAAVDAEGHDGVRVMTVHAAKGLEFPVVAVADLGRGIAAGFPPALRLEPAPAEADAGADFDAGAGFDAGPGFDGDAPAMRVGLQLARLGRKRLKIYEYVELEAAAVEREREEERRILHVAMTRAQERLILSGVHRLAKLGEPKDTDPLIAPVLRALRWDGDADTVELEPPAAREGLERELRPARVAIRVRRPDDAALQSPVPASTPGEAADADSLAALPDPDLAPLAPVTGPPVRAVSYSALASYGRCGYRFYAERVLGLRAELSARHASPAEEVELDGDSGAADEWHAGTADDALATRYARGRVVHELLERSARSGWAAPDREHAASLLTREGVPAGPPDVSRAVGLVEGFLRSPLREALPAGASAQPEVPFAFRAGRLVVRGEIDLLVDLGDEVLVVDYKSDALRAEAPQERVSRYEVQRRIYALAALRRYGKPVRVAYVFLERPEAAVEASFGTEDVAALAEELERLVASIEAGSFEVTSEPERSLCFDCPARERLCVHPPELTMREPAAA